jgi:hypothetical protein
MTITVTHRKVSTVPNGSDESLVRPSDWNDTHQIVGLGTAAALDAGTSANNVVQLDIDGKLPAVDGSALTGITGGGGSPGGSDTQVQFNDDGAFGGDSGLTFDKATGRLTIGSSGSAAFSTDLIFRRRAAANLQLGAADAAAPVAQTLSVQSVIAGTTNTAGANFTIDGSQGTGTGAGGSIVFRVAPAGSSGTAQNALVTFAEITEGRSLNLYNTTDVTTNFERGFMRWSSNVLQIGAEKGGAGTARALRLIGTIVEVSVDNALFQDSFNQSLKLHAGYGIGWCAGVASDGATLVTRLTRGNRSGFGVELTVGSYFAAPVLEVSSARTVATLPATPLVGQMARVTDADTPAVGSTVAGGGAAAALVWYNGANWTVIGV